MENAFAQNVSTVLKFFKVSESEGLSAEAVVGARQKYGRNGKFMEVGN